MIFSEILNEISPDWTVIEKARKIYTRLAEEIIYDDRFSFFSDKKILLDIYNRNIDIDKDENHVMVCKPANITYMNLLNKVGIKAELIYKKSAVNRTIDVPDVSCVFYDECDRKIYTNIIGDLSNCKYGLSTNCFGVNDVSYENSKEFMSLEKEQLELIDRKIGYIKIDYSDLVFKLIVEEVKNTNHFKKFLDSQGIDSKNLSDDQILENKLQYVTKLIQFRNINAGNFERKQLYKKLFRSSILDKFESKKFMAYEFFKTINENIEYISCIGINLSENNVFFIYSDEDDKYEQISIENLQEKIKGYEESHGKTIDFEQMGRTFYANKKFSHQVRIFYLIDYFFVVF